MGIVASRLKDRFHRPAIVFARAADGTLRGSGRSIAGFHLRDALDLVTKRSPGTIERYGGHAFAAGLTLAEAALPAFKHTLEEIAREQLTPAQLRRECDSDGVLDAGELTLDLAQAVRAQVWGQGMPVPTFDDIFSIHAARIVGGRHTRLTLERDGEPGPRFEAMLFQYAEALPPRIRAVYRPEVNAWQGAVSLQLVVEHWQPA